MLNTSVCSACGYPHTGACPDIPAVVEPIMGWVEEQTTASNWGNVPDAEVAEFVAAMERQSTYLRKIADQATWELIRRLEARGARELAHPTLEVKLVYPSPVYEAGKLMGLAEVVPPDDFELAYQPEWVKQVPQAARFDGRQLNVLARKYGEPVTALLEQAKLPSTPKLVVKAKGGDTHT